MENTQKTRKWSDLRGLAVVTLYDGKKAGTCDDFYFDPATQQIYALRVKTGLFGRRALLVTDINGIGKDAIERQRLQHGGPPAGPGGGLPGRDRNRASPAEHYRKQ